MHRRRRGKLVLAGNDFQNVVRLDHLALGQVPPEWVVDEIKPFVLGGVQQLEILLDRGSFCRVLEQPVIGHAKSRRRVHVVPIFVVDKRTRLTDQGVDYVAKLDVFLAAAELRIGSTSGHAAPERTQTADATFDTCRRVKSHSTAPSPRQRGGIGRR